MWTVVYLAHNGENAAKIYSCLRSDGVKVRMRPACKNNMHGYEILVPEREISSAHSIIFANRT